MKYRFSFPITARRAEPPRYHFDRREIECRANYEKLCTYRHAYVKSVAFRQALAHAYRIEAAAQARADRIVGIINSGFCDFLKDEKDWRKRSDLYWRKRENLRAAFLQAKRDKDTALAQSLADRLEALQLVHRAVEKRPRAKLNDFSWIDRLGPLPEAIDEK